MCLSLCFNILKRGKFKKSYASSGIRTLNPWGLRLRNTCAIGCAKKTTENVFKLKVVIINTLHTNNTLTIYCSIRQKLNLLFLCFLEKISIQGTSGWAPLLIALMYEYNNPDSVWRPYLDLVPDFDELDLPMFWPR